MNQRLLPAAIAIAGALVALAIFLHPAGPHYALVYTGFSNAVYRLDTRTGTMMLCQGNSCGEVSTMTSAEADVEMRQAFKDDSANGTAPQR